MPGTSTRRRSGRGSDLKSGLRRRNPRRALAPMRSGAVEEDFGDLRRSAEAHRGPPVTRAAAHVDLRALMVEEPRDVRLLQLHEEVERKELATVRVAGELEAHARAGCVVDRLRLV